MEAFLVQGFLEGWELLKPLRRPYLQLLGDLSPLRASLFILLLGLFLFLSGSGAELSFPSRQFRRKLFFSLYQILIMARAKPDAILLKPFQVVVGKISQQGFILSFQHRFDA